MKKKDTKKIDGKGNRMMRYEKEIFGTMDSYILSTDTEPQEIKEGDTVYLVNSNCEFEYDNIKGDFQKDLMYYIICDLELIESDLTGYEPSKSNNGGAYAFATCKIKKIKEIK